MNFEKWLKENSMSAGEVTSFGTRDDDFIKTSALGEWVWEAYLERKKERDESIWSLRGINYFGMRDMLEIANVCLGKKEIFKRLKGEMNYEVKFRKLEWNFRNTKLDDCKKGEK